MFETSNQIGFINHYQPLLTTMNHISNVSYSFSALSWGTPALLRFLLGAAVTSWGGRVGSRGLKNRIFDNKMVTTMSILYPLVN